MSRPLLEVRNLRVEYATASGLVRAIDDVSLTLHPGEILGIAGESGSGKSTLAQAILRVLPPPAIITGGAVEFEGRDLLGLDESELRALRWSRISMVFQGAMDALNPVITVGEQILDTLRAHARMEPTVARNRALELLRMVGLPNDCLSSHAHQLSGGMRQRVGIALALALHPALVILDEPTTALDVIVEREILEGVRALQQKLGFAVLFITHDLARMLEVSDRVAIFYGGRVAEVGTADQVRRSPAHPYTQGLLRAFPSLHGDPGRLASIPGAPPTLRNPPPGCRFHPRCPVAVEACRISAPPMIEVAPSHRAACHLAASESPGDR
ncbi:MAG: ABC transporter ATP-binding protein [Candidatus Eisenbacteria bacterium]|nr:ABC transporter ATP-binding protein [Candidatus Eisenbacteria bacterium]